MVHALLGGVARVPHNVEGLDERDDEERLVLAEGRVEPREPHEEEEAEQAQVHPEEPAASRGADAGGGRGQWRGRKAR
eukprot:3899867-Prymnesium_polylepis.1